MAGRGQVRHGSTWQRKTRFTTIKANRLGGGFVRLGKAGLGVAGRGQARQDKVYHRLLDTAGDGFIRRLRA